MNHNTNTIIIDANVMMKLTDENQEKVVHIYHIASILNHHKDQGSTPLTWENFCSLYDSKLSDLEVHTNNYAAKFNVPTPDVRIRNVERPQQREYPHDCD